MHNVINLRSRQPKPEPLDVSEYSTVVGGDRYHVRRAVDRDTGVGILTVRDDLGRPVLVRGSGVPDSVIPDLIHAWRTGRGIGRREGGNAVRAELAALMRQQEF